MPIHEIGYGDGVFVPCLLNILGIIVFLRLGWVVGNAGLGLTTLIILLSTLIAIITTLSMSAICTSREMLEGGPYYLISRSLGPRLGGSIGLLYVVSNALSASFSSMGIAETFADNVGWPRDYWILVGIGLVACTMTMLVALVGVRWVAKFQWFLLIALLLPFIPFFIGAFIPPSSNDPISNSVTGFNLTTFEDNVEPNFLPNVNFLTVFGVYFPAATGFLAGASLSGDLRTAAKSVPLGTFLAIGLTTVLYLLVAWFLGSVATRNALQTNYFIMETVSVVRPLFLVGLYVASFSGILSSLIAGPRVLQSIALDDILPPLRIFGKTAKFNKEPMRAYCVVFILALGGVFFGNLNILAPLNTMFSLLMYCMLNYACFACSTGDARIGWNPSFRFYNRWVSLLGAIACFVFMFLVEWISAIVAVSLAVILYFIIAYIDAHVAFGYFHFNMFQYLGFKSSSFKGMPEHEMANTATATAASFGTKDLKENDNPFEDMNLFLLQNKSPVYALGKEEEEDTVYFPDVMDMENLDIEDFDNNDPDLMLTEVIQPEKERS